MKQDFGGKASTPHGYGWYAYHENGKLVIGDNYPHEGGELYRGLYKGENTPYLNEIKKEEPHLYNTIVKFYTTFSNTDIERSVSEECQSILASATLNDIQKLDKIFELKKDKIRSFDAYLYYAILGVLDANKVPSSGDYFKN